MQKNWKECLIELAELGEQLAFKPELLQSLRTYANSTTTPPARLFYTLQVMASISKQNQRVAELHGYPGLEIHAKNIEDRLVDAVLALKRAGFVNPEPPVQAQVV